MIIGMMFGLMWVAVIVVVCVYASRELQGMGTGERRGPPGQRSRKPRLLRFRVRRYSGEIREDIQGFTTASVDLEGDSPGTLKIFPVGLSVRIGHRYGDQDLRVGDEEFDREMVIKARPESLAYRLFSVERRAEVIAAVRKLAAFRAFSIDLSRGSLSVRVSPGPRVDGPAGRMLIRVARDLAEFILDIAEGAGIEWVAAGNTPAAQATCQICGSDMSDQVVHCARCRTPHHQECWEFTGKCSTYACPETRYRTQGWLVTPPPPLRERQKPRDWLREEVRRDREETGGSPEASP